MGRPLAITFVSLAITGCRADVAGSWEGHIGADRAELFLEQAGAAIDGRLCFAQACAEVAGSLVDQRLELELGCLACDVVATTLDLDVAGNTLRGTAILHHCDPSQGPCLLPVALKR